MMSPTEPAQSVPAAFVRFAQVAQEVGATTKRLEKAALLAVYFDTLDDSSLTLAARYFAGYAFPLRDQRRTNIGGAALLSALAAVTGADDTYIRQQLVVLGDIGDAAGALFAASQTLAANPARLDLAAVNALLESLAETSGSKRKIEMLVEVLSPLAPLEAKYLVKVAGGDLRIGLQEGAVEDAVARWTENEVGRVQWVNMLTGDIGETAILARHGQLDSARMRLFHPIKFMLATAAADLTDVQRQMPPSFVVEDKYDGIRAQAHVAPARPGDALLHGVVVNGRRVALFSRTLDEITKSFPDLLEPLASLFPLDTATEEKDTGIEGDSPGIILDGEILPVLGDKILPFQQLQQRLNRKTFSEKLLADIPVAFVAYDILYGQGRILLTEPFAERRQVLETLPSFGGGTRVTPSRHFDNVALLDAEFEAARARGNEGLMVKDPASAYKPGRRGRDWLKIKRALAALDVVVTAVEVGNGRRHTVLSDYTFAVRTSESDPTLLNVGKAYSGLTDEEIASLSEWFRAHTTQEYAHGKVRVVEPKIVIEVTFDRVQPSKRHKSGFALRFPRILRIRHDKPAEEIDTLETVRRLAELSPADDTEAENGNA